MILLARQEEQAISAREWALCQLTLCFELQSTSESGKGHKNCAPNLTWKRKSKVKSDQQKESTTHDFLEVVFTSKPSKTNNIGDTGYLRIAITQLCHELHICNNFTML